MMRKMCGIVPKMCGVRYDAENVRHGAENVPPNTKNVRHGDENVQHGVPIPQSPIKWNTIKVLERRSNGPTNKGSDTQATKQEL